MNAEAKNGENDMVVKSKCDAVVEDLISKIVNRVYAAGDRLPTETELCAAYGVSRVTIRESLKKLQMMDMISIEQGRGTFVRKFGLGHVMRPMFNLIDFGDFDIRTIYDARLYIETGTCRLAALNRTEDDLRALDATMERMILCRDGAEGTVPYTPQEVDTEFHIAVAAASHNEILKAAVINLENISAACADRLHKSHTVLDDAAEDHRQMLEAIRRRDPDAAERAVVAHTRKSMDVLL